MNIETLRKIEELDKIKQSMANEVETLVLEFYQGQSKRKFRRYWDSIDFKVKGDEIVVTTEEYCCGDTDTATIRIPFLFITNRVAYWAEKNAELEAINKKREEIKAKEKALREIKGRAQRKRLYAELKKEFGP